jgi:hypothetical protein
MKLLELPQEMLGNVLSHLLPNDIVAFGRTCRSAHLFIDPSNQILWRSVFLQVFDDPREAWSGLVPHARGLNQSVEEKWNWQQRLKQRLLALKAISDDWTMAMLDNPPSPSKTIDALLDMIETARTGPTDEQLQQGQTQVVDDMSSLNMSLLPTRYNYGVKLDRLLRGSHIPPGCGHDDEGSFEVSGWRPTARPTTRSMTSPGSIPRSESACKLHVMAGVSPQESQDTRALGAARQVVYNWQTTNADNEYGPFKYNGDVDWRRLEAIMTVATGHFSRAVQGRLTLPQGFNYSIPARTTIDPSQPQDWAGVTGNWCGTYVFLNWEDLLLFNAHAGERPSLDDGPESCGGLMKLEVKLDETIKDDPKLRTELPLCDDLPPLFFSGLSRSWEYQMTTGVRGMACLTPSGKEVRWRIIVQ